jgi:hypothetical protein
MMLTGGRMLVLSPEIDFIIAFVVIGVWFARAGIDPLFIKCTQRTKLLLPMKMAGKGKALLKNDTYPTESAYYINPRFRTTGTTAAVLPARKL